MILVLESVTKKHKVDSMRFICNASLVRSRALAVQLKRGQGSNGSHVRGQMACMYVVEPVTVPEAAHQTREHAPLHFRATV